MFTLLLPLMSLASLVKAILLPTRNDQNAGDIKDVISVIVRISSGVSKVGFHSLNSGTASSTAPIKLSTTFMSSFQISTTVVDTLKLPYSWPLRLIQLIFPLTTLVGIVDRYATGIIAKKSLVKGLSIDPQFMDVFERLRLAALDVARVITQKLPGIVEWAAVPATDQIIEKLDKVIKAYNNGQSRKSSQSASNPSAW